MTDRPTSSPSASQRGSTSNSPAPDAQTQVHSSSSSSTLVASSSQTGEYDSTPNYTFVPEEVLAELHEISHMEWSLNIELTPAPSDPHPPPHPFYGHSYFMDDPIPRPRGSVNLPSWPLQMGGIPMSPRLTGMFTDDGRMRVPDTDAPVHPLPAETASTVEWPEHYITPTVRAAPVARRPPPPTTAPTLHWPETYITPPGVVQVSDSTSTDFSQETNNARSNPRDPESDSEDRL